MMRVQMVVLVAVLVTALGLAACTTTPPAAGPRPAPVAGGGMVIATVACHFLPGDADATKPMLVRFERLDGPRSSSYLLPARLDERSQRGFLAGALPEGAYEVREALLGGHRLAVSGLPMAFEVRPDRVTDFGHYNLAPATVSAGYTENRF